MKKILALTLAILFIFGLTACGKKAADPEKTTEKGKEVVVGYTLYEPMNYKDESGKLVGFDTELAEAVFANLGYKVIFQEIYWVQ